MGKYFGTDGFRGHFGTDLNTDHALKIGQFLGFYYKSKGFEGVVVGMDTRESGPFLKTALAMGVNSSGINVFDLDVIPTPGVAYIAKKYNMPGVVISASHNPYSDNGIKILNERGEKLEETIILAIEEYIDSSSDNSLNRIEGKTIPFSKGKEEYIEHLVSLGSDYTGLKVLIDLSNGAASSVAKEVFKRLNLDVTFINDKPDGKNINNGCGSTVMECVQQCGKGLGYDVSFAYDGDADRCLFVDEKSNILTGDHTLYLCGKELKEENKLNNNTVVATIMSNFGLFIALDKLGIEYAKTNVGDKYVYEYMKNNDCSIGGEQSGHIIFMNDATTGDGILTSIKILNILAEKKQKLSTLVSDFVVYPQVLQNVIVKDKKVVLEDLKLQKFIEEQEKTLNKTGRVLVRASGTEPKIRVMAEAKDEITCNHIVTSIVAKIKELGYMK